MTRRHGSMVFGLLKRGSPDQPGESTDSAPSIFSSFPLGSLPLQAIDSKFLLWQAGPQQRLSPPPSGHQGPQPLAVAAELALVLATELILLGVWQPF